MSVALTTANGIDLRLRVEDNGVGFGAAAPNPGPFGIVGRCEQAHLIGTELAIDSAPGRGTRLSIVLRLAPVVL